MRLVESTRRLLILCASLLAVVMLAAACSGAAVPAQPETEPAATDPGTIPTNPGGSTARLEPEHQPATRATSPPRGSTLRFDHYSLEEGLSQSVAKAIVQDNSGFLWVGTEDGLNRFDGYGFTVYRHDPDDPHSLSNNHIEALYQDPSGSLWIATYGGGLDRYDPATGRFAHYRHDPGDPNSLSDDYTLALGGDRDGAIWIGTRNSGLNRLVLSEVEGAGGEEEHWRHYRHDPDDPGSLSSDTVTSVLGDASGALWVGTIGGLNRLNPGEDRFVHYRSDPASARGLSGNAIETIYQDASGDLWVGTSDGGLNWLDPDTGIFVRYRHTPTNPHSLSNDTVTSVVVDSLGVPWIGTADGLNQFDPDSQRFTHHRNDPGDPNSLSENQITAIYEDRAGGLWIGTYGGGLQRYDRMREQFSFYHADPRDPNSLSENGIWSIYQDREGVLWVGTDGGGLDRFDPETGEWRHHRHDSADPHSLSNDVVVSIFEDSSGVLWLGTWGGGLNRLDREAGNGQAARFTAYQYKPGDDQSLSSNVVWAIEKDRDGTLWVGTAYGLNRFDPQTGAFTRFYHDPDDPSSLSDNNVGSIFEDRSGTLWFGTHKGLNRYDPQTGRFARYQHDPDDPQSLSHNIIFTIHQDPSGALWLGTWGGGLNRFDPESETFTHYRVKDGLPNDVVYGILEDDAGHLWLSTNNGISRFDPKTETFENFDADDGLQSNEFNFNAYYRSPGGEMYFGGINGFNAFHPDRISENPYLPPVTLTSVFVGGEPLASGMSPESLEDLTLKWPDNDFEFEFAALSFFQPEKNRYAYLLEGFDDAWNHIGTRRYGGYTNLPGGTYTLRIRGANSDGVWNEEGVSLPVTVVPPFWDTWPFRGIVALVLLAGIACGYRLRTRGIERRSSELEEQVASRTKELAALNAISAVVSRSLDLQETLTDAVDTTLEVMGLEAGGIYLLHGEASEDEGILKIAAHRGLSAEHIAQADNLLVGEGFSGFVVQTCEPLVVGDVATDPRLTRSVVKESGFRTVAIAPLVSRARVLGTLFVMTRQETEFSPQDLELLMAIGGQIGVAVQNSRFFEAEQRRAEQFRTLSDASRHITAVLDVDQSLQAIVHEIEDSFGFYVVGLGLIEGDELVMRATAGIDWHDPTISPLRVKVGGEGVMAWVAATGQPLLVPDVDKEPRYLAWPADARTRSEITVPLKTKSGVIGVLNVESEKLGAFDRGDLAVLQSLANQAAIAIENARFFEAEQHRADQFRVIAEVGRRLTVLLDVNEVLAQVTRLVQETFGYYHVAIGLIEGDEVVYRVGAGELWDDPAFGFKPARLKVGEEGLTGWVAARGEAIVVPDVSQEPRYIWMQGSKTRSELAVPLVVKGQVIGVLDAQSDRLDAFDDTDLAVLQSLAHQAGAAIENARLYEQAQQAAVVEERNRLARDLHDAVTQTLFSASLIAEAVPASWEIDPDEGRELLSELRQLTRGALAEMRTLLLELRPAALIDANMSDLLAQLAEAASGRMGAPVELTVEGLCQLPPDVHVALYRIAQEALNNVVKHARASQATIHLRCEPAHGEMDGKGRVELRITDDGRGFDPAGVGPDHLGLGIMRERAQAIGAALEIDTRPGSGTRIALVWPGD